MPISFPFYPFFFFFERNKTLQSFDTIISFDDQGFGSIDNFYNFIEAGHIFSKTQEHVVLFYDIAMRDYQPLARLVIYKKYDPGLWCKIFSDTISVSDFRFRYKDWNNGGIRDFSYVIDGWEHGGHGPVTWYLWLVGTDGLLNKVEGFEELNDPRIDSLTNHIFTNTIANHSGTDMDEYKFAGNKLVKLRNIYVDFDDSKKNFYARYIAGDKLGKKIKLRSDDVYNEKYDPEDN